jgi:hypothetical protein
MFCYVPATSTWSYKDIFIVATNSTNHRFERITKYNLELASEGNSLETVGSYVNNS